MSSIEESSVQLSAAWHQTTGENHRRRNETLQDVVLISQENGLSIFGLADGQSGRSHSAEGGRCVLNRIADCIKAHGLREFARCSYQDELKYVLMRNIRRALADLKDELGLSDVRELSSTLMMIAVDEKTGEYMTIHLGDGAIIGARSDGSIRIVSEPENGMTSQYTYLSTSDDAMMHLRIAFGRIHSYSRIVMVTDGAASICRGSNISLRSRRLIQEAQRDDFAGILSADAPLDDASVIVVDVAPRTQRLTMRIAFD